MVGRGNQGREKPGGFSYSWCSEIAGSEAAQKSEQGQSPEVRRRRHGLSESSGDDQSISKSFGTVRKNP
jgi:hypothetical protein